MLLKNESTSIVLVVELGGCGVAGLCASADAAENLRSCCCDLKNDADNAGLTAVGRGSG